LIGQALAQARGLLAKSAIKQVDRLLSNAGVVPWDLFAPWVHEVVGVRREIVVAMDWTDFDADNYHPRAASREPATDGRRRRENEGIHEVSRYGSELCVWSISTLQHAYEDFRIIRCVRMLADSGAFTKHHRIRDIQLFDYS